jgi:hypothetical protein
LKSVHHYQTLSIDLIHRPYPCPRLTSNIHLPYLLPWESMPGRHGERTSPISWGVTYGIFARVCTLPNDTYCTVRRTKAPSKPKAHTVPAAHTWYSRCSCTQAAHDTADIHLVIPRQQQPSMWLRLHLRRRTTMKQRYISYIHIRRTTLSRRLSILVVPPVVSSHPTPS